MKVHYVFIIFFLIQISRENDEDKTKEEPSVHAIIKQRIEEANSVKQSYTHSKPKQHIGKQID